MWKNWKLFLILGIAFFLRFYQLGINPPSLTWDEVAWGYNAYSLSIDGRDEFGRFLPFDYLESFGDFKPPVYAYLSVIPIIIFGLNEFAVRFPSAFFGVLTVILTYFLTKRIFKDNTHRELYALLSSLFLAVSPWHIMLSRAAFEANVATFFIVAGVWLFLKAVQGRLWWLMASAGCFVISMYTFNTARIVVPILVLVLAVGFWRTLLAQKKQTIISGIIGFILLLPIIPFLLSPQASLRFQEVNIFSDISVIERSNQEIANDDHVFWSKVIHNRRLAYGVEYVKHYLDNLHPKFLFTKGDGNPKFSTQDVGELYLFELPFFIVGLLFLFRRREGYWWIIPLWLFIGIIPAATARETPHALRIETTVPTLQLISAYGAVTILLFVKKIQSSLYFLPIKSVVLGIIFLIFILNIYYFLHGYFAHYPREYSSEWQYGYKEAVLFAKKHENSFDDIYVTTALGRPYIYFLFYQQRLPVWFRENAEVKRDVFGFVNVERMEKYRFSDDLSTADSEKKNLFIETPLRVPKNATILKKFLLLNGETVLVAYTTR